MEGAGIHMIIITNSEGTAGLGPALAVLREGGHALDAVEAGIMPVEADPAVRSVGRGGAPNMLGIVECDAAIMNGTTLETGAVGALQRYLHAISVARGVMERLPHVMLVGEGAARFAAELGLAPAELLTDAARAAYHSWVRAHPPAGAVEREHELPHHTSPAAGHVGGTVIYLVNDAQGHVAAGASTSGWAFKYPGRLGDSPVIGAGIYADDRYGACGCTHTGEMTIRCGTARSVVLYMKRGASVIEACHEAAADLCHLRRGFIGPVIIHAFDRGGTPYALAVLAPGPIDYWSWTDDLVQPHQRTCATHEE